MNRSILALLFLFFGIVASSQARDMGRWLCAECTIDGWKDGQTIPAADDIIVFIKSTVNPSKFGQIPGIVGPKDGWKPNDVIVICNGARCQMLMYHPSGMFLALGGSYTDVRAKYVNTKSPVNFGPGVGRNQKAYKIQVTGHWQWYDYYSDGAYTGSGEMEYVITSIDWVEIGGGLELEANVAN